MANGGIWDDDSPYDQFDPESTFYQDDEIIQTFWQQDLAGFTSRFGEGLEDEESLRDTDFIIDADGTLREKTLFEKLFRDYGIVLAGIVAFLAFKFA